MGHGLLRLECSSVRATRARGETMDIKIDQDSEVGEYDSAMQTLLQLIWGEGFLSPGGAEEVAYLLEGSDIRGCKVLDIGAGLGAIEQLLLRQHGPGWGRGRIRRK